MKKLIDEFRHGWQGISQPSLLFSTGFAAGCLALSTIARWAMAQIRPDVFFVPYFPAVFFAAAVGGARIGIATAIAGGALGVIINFSSAVADSARLALLVLFWAVCGFAIWGVEHYRAIVVQQREDSKRLIEEEEYRKLLVDELQHRLKNKTSTIHAVLHQVLQNQPQIWGSIDSRLRALSATDDLIARVDGSGCDIKDLLRSELGPYGHVRFNLNGDPLFLPAKLAVSLALIFHELATNAAKYGALSAAEGRIEIDIGTGQEADNIRIVWKERGGPEIQSPPNSPGFGSRLIELSITNQLRGDLVYAWDRDGLQVIAVVPKSSMCRTG